MKYTYAFLVKYRYRIFLSLTVLLLTEVVQPLIGIVSFEHERIFVWMSFLTLMACMGIAVLIGVVSPVSRRTMNYAYLGLVAVPLIIFVNYMLMRAGVYSDILWGAGIPILLWLGLAGLTGAVASSGRNTKVFLILVVFPLIVAAWTGLLMIMSLAATSHSHGWLWTIIIWGTSAITTALLVAAIILRITPSSKSRTVMLYIIISLKAVGISIVPFLMIVALPFLAVFVVFGGLPYLSAAIVAGAGTVLVGTIRDPFRRNITVTVIGLLGMIVVLGSYWVWTIDNGLDKYSGEDLARAKSALIVEWSAHCNYAPTEYRVVQDDRGWVRLIPYTFWRLPGQTCKHYFHWNGVAG